MMDESKSQNWQTVMPDGLVVDNKDPEKAGRVRVRVAGLHDNIPDDHLPWAINGNASGRGPSSNAAQVRIPHKGSRVKVNFQQGDPTNPEYMGGVMTKASIPEVFKTNYPHRNGEMFPNGTHWYLDEQANTFFFTHGGLTATIDGGGNLKITTGGTVTVKSSSFTSDAPQTSMTGQTTSQGLVTGNSGMVMNAGPGGGAGTMNGTIRVKSGDVIVQGGDVKADTITLKTHKHDGVQSGSGSTSQAIPG